MAPLDKALVISGMRTGIGRELALAAIGRGYTVIGCSSSARDAVRSDAALAKALDDRTLHYLSVDVAGLGQIAGVAARYKELTGRTPAAQLDVIANAGIARWGDPGKPEDYEDMQRMWAVNVDGTRHLADAMQPHLSAAGRANFVAMSSIVAARGQAIGGNDRYMASKHAVQYYATGTLVHDPRFEGINTFAVAPGVVPTPMIMDELLLPMIFRVALVQARDDAAFAETLAKFVPDGQSADAATLAANTPADNVRVLFADLLASNPKLARLEGALDDDLELTRRALASFMRNARRPGPMRKRILAIVYALDLAVTPEVVATRILDQLDPDAGRPPLKKRLLEVYSKGGGDPILKLMRAL